MLEECDICPGRFLRYTAKLEYNLPTKYCSKCGKQLVVRGELEVESYNTETGKPYKMTATLACPDWKKPYKDWFHPKTLIKSKHDCRDMRGAYNEDKIEWVS